MTVLSLFVAFTVFPIISAKCTEPDISKYFASSTLPWDNHRRISGAVFPPTKLPSLLINVRVVFVNESSPSINSTDVCSSGHKAGDLNYKWSLACLYVSGGVSLNTMTFFSLATIYPQRRETQLCLKLPQKCRSVVENEEVMKSFLSELQSIAIRPTAPDASKNTVKCIVADRGENHCQGTNCWSLSDGVFHTALCGTWIYVLLASFIFSLCVAAVLDDHLKQSVTRDAVREKNEVKKKAAIEAMNMTKDVKDAVRAIATEERQSTLTRAVRAAERAVEGIVDDGLYKQPNAKAAKAALEASVKVAAVADVVSAVKAEATAALVKIEAEVRETMSKAVAEAKEVKTQLASAATTEIISVVREMATLIASGRVVTVEKAARQRGLEAAMSVANEEIGNKQGTANKEISNIQQKVLLEMAQAAVNASEEVAIAAAEAALADVMTEATAVDKEADGIRNSMGSVTKEAKEKAMKNGPTAVSEAKEALRGKENVMRRAAILAAENAADNFLVMKRNGGSESLIKVNVNSAGWTAVAAKALTAKEAAAEAARAAKEAADKASEAARTRVILGMLQFFMIVEVTLLIFTFSRVAVSCGRDAIRDVGFYSYSVIFLSMFTALFISKCRCYSKWYHCLLYPTRRCWSVVIYPSLFSVVHHFMWSCLGIITEPFWAFPILMAISSFLFVVYFIAHIFRTVYWETCKLFPWYSFWHSAGSVSSFLIFMLTVLLVGQSLSSENFISNISQGILVLVMTTLYRYVNTQ